MKLNTEQAVCAALGVVWERIDPGEVAKLIGLLPEDLRDLWPVVAREG